MTARQEVHKIGFELICRYSSIRMRLAAVVPKIAILQELIRKRCVDAALPTMAGRRLSGTQQVLEVIQKSEKGVDPWMIRQVTGFSEQKTAKILYKLFKGGEIRIGSGGLYLAAAIR